jgi:uncharacterized membrane protein
MQLDIPISIHLATVLPALAIGAVNLCRPKGTPSHRLLGRIWVPLMLIAAFTSFFIKSDGSFSWIHILSIVTITNVVLGFIAIRNGKIKIHQGCIVGAYVGTLIAGIFAVIIPGRFVYQLLIGT